MFTRNLTRLLARSYSSSTKQRIIRQVTRDVYPFAKLSIIGSFNFKIRPYDLLDNPAGNPFLRATIFGPADSEIKVGTEAPDIKVDVDGQHAYVYDDGAQTGLDCVLEVPVKADISLETSGHATISEMYSDVVVVSANGIETKNLRATAIDFHSIGGDIRCDGLTLAQLVKIASPNGGDIVLEKVQGEELMVLCYRGTCDLKSGYSTRSFFDCMDGRLRLANLHRTCRIQGTGKGELSMSGFYGTLSASLEDFLVSLQLSELSGKSRIECSGSREAVINLGERVLDECRLDLSAGKGLEVDDSVAQLGGKVEQSGEKARLSHASELAKGENELEVMTAGALRLSRMSWADSFKFSEGGELNTKLR